MDLGLVQTRQGNYEDALASFQKTIVIFRTLGQFNARGESTLI